MNLKLDANFDLEFFDGQIVTVEGPEETVQRIALSFAVLLGEWFLDLGFGYPWLSLVLVKGPDLSTIEEFSREFVGAVRGVKRVLSLTLTGPTVARLLTIDFRALDETGEEIAGDVLSPTFGEAV